MIKKCKAPLSRPLTQVYDVGGPFKQFRLHVTISYVFLWQLLYPSVVVAVPHFLLPSFSSNVLLRNFWLKLSYDSLVHKSCFFGTIFFASFAKCTLFYAHSVFLLISFLEKIRFSTSRWCPCLKIALFLEDGNNYLNYLSRWKYFVFVPFLPICNDFFSFSSIWYVVHTYGKIWQVLYLIL